MNPPIEPHLWITDMDRSLAWYRTLGFEIAESYPDAEHPTWVQLKRGNAAAMLAVAPASDGYVAEVPGRLAGPGGAVSLYLHVDSADRLHEEIQAAGLEIIEPIWDAWWGGRQFTMRDPDGHWWTAFEARTDETPTS